jgi:transposase
MMSDSCPALASALILPPPAARRRFPSAYRVRLTPVDRERLTFELSVRTMSARRIQRAEVLLLLDDGRTVADAARAAKVSEMRVRRVAGRYQTQGLQAALGERKRPGRTRVHDDAARDAIVALALATPPEGVARWTVRRLAQEAVRRGLVAAISHTTVGAILAARGHRSGGGRRGEAAATVPVATGA